MTFDSSLVQYFFAASPVVKVVMAVLLIASFISWVFIFQRWFFLRFLQKRINDFEKKYFGTSDLAQLYGELGNKDNLVGLEKMFSSGFKEFVRLRKNSNIRSEAVMENVRRSMRIVQRQEADKLEKHLPFLATVGSTSPYVGLFGTVWGIMMAFQALGHVQQATISMVAPGISEALIATAMGLFAAIPAVIAYNRYTNRVERILNRYESFEEEFLNYLHGN
jgi:biopolymer transport protein TolQ